jgi:hypothetical protein
MRFCHFVLIHLLLVIVTFNLNCKRPPPREVRWGRAAVWTSVEANLRRCCKFESTLSQQRALYVNINNIALRMQAMFQLLQHGGYCVGRVLLSAVR